MTSTARLTTRKRTLSEQHVGHDRGLVAPQHRVRHPPPDAGPPEDDLDDHGALEQEAEREPDDGHGRDQRVAAGVTPDDDPLRQTLGPGGVDVVLAELLDERGPHHPGDDRAGPVAERHARAGRGATPRPRAPRGSRPGSRRPCRSPWGGRSSRRHVRVGASERATSRASAQKTISSRIPNQKVGMLAPLIEKTRVTWSGHLLRRAPANVPSAIPSETATIADETASSIVAASLSGNTSVTGAAETPDQPKSPWQTRPGPGQVLHGRWARRARTAPRLRRPRPGSSRGSR